MPSGSRKWRAHKIESVAKNWLVLVEFAAHVHVLRALAGEEEDRRDARGRARDRFLSLDAVQSGDGCGVVFDHQRAAIGESCAAKLAGECRVGQGLFWMRSQVRCQIREGLIGSGRGFR